MPKDDKMGTAKQKEFWESRRHMMKGQQPYDEKKGAKDAKAALDAQKGKK